MAASIHGKGVALFNYFIHRIEGNVKELQGGTIQKLYNITIQKRCY
jgi:hypothetical protein